VGHLLQQSFIFVRVIAVVKFIIADSLLPAIFLILQLLLLPQSLLTLVCKLQCLPLGFTHQFSSDLYPPECVCDGIHLGIVKGVLGVLCVWVVSIVVCGLDGVVQSGIELGLRGATRGSYMLSYNPGRGT
jgi:hypothetical protein